MLSIDEAIQIENKISEENQKIVDTEIIFDGVSLSQLYCDDTEVIEEHLENYKKCAKYHKQLSEWLEELKAYRENSNGYNKEDIELNRNAMYNKAIDDFVKALCIEYAPVNDKMQKEYDNVCLRFERIAEQLKEDRKNENYNKEES